MGGDCTAAHSRCHELSDAWALTQWFSVTGRLSMAPTGPRRQPSAGGNSQRTSSSQDSRPASAQQAELRAKLAAFKEGKGARGAEPPVATQNLHSAKPPRKAVPGTAPKPPPRQRQPARDTQAAPGLMGTIESENATEGVVPAQSPAASCACAASSQAPAGCEASASGISPASEGQHTADGGSPAASPEDRCATSGTLTTGQKPKVAPGLAAPRYHMSSIAIKAA